MVGTLGHVLEAAGLATVGIASVRGQIESTAPPRALYAEFPLGRPLGKPDDPEYQKKVLVAAFALLEEPSGPVLVDYPDVITADVEEALVCQMPPRYDPELHPAVDEVQGLRAAYNRTVERRGTTSVGRIGSVDDMVPIIEAFVRIADGVLYTEADIPGGDINAAAMEIRSYYEEVAMSLADHIDGARQVDAWIYGETEAGALVHEVQAKVKAVPDVDRGHWNYLVPMMHHRSTL